MHPKQVEIYRSMTPEKKLQIAASLYWSARRLKEAALRDKHPGWSDQQIDEEVKRIFLYART